MTDAVALSDLVPPEPERSPREREIIDAAARLFDERGYAATSIQDVADAVGILKGSLYYYIDSKEDLLFEILQDCHHASMRRLWQWQQVEGDALVRLRAFVEGHVLANLQDLVKIGVFLHDFRSLSEKRREAIVADRDVYDRYLRGLIEEGQQDGLVDPDADPKLTAMALLGMMNWVYQWYTPAGRVKPVDLARQFADLALSGLAVRQGDRSTIGALPEGFEAQMLQEELATVIPVRDGRRGTAKDRGRRKR